VTPIAQLKNIKEMGIHLSVIARKTGIEYHRMMRVMRGQAKGFDAAETQKIAHVHKVSVRWEKAVRATYDNG